MEWIGPGPILFIMMIGCQTSSGLNELAADLYLILVSTGIISGITSGHRLGAGDPQPLRIAVFRLDRHVLGSGS